MNRHFLTTLSCLACFINLSIAQTDTSAGTGSGPNETPYPQPPSIPYCEDKCGKSVDAEQSASGEYACPAGSTEVENDSCGLKLNFGLTTYSTSSSFLKQDQSLRISPSKGYNPPCVGIPPFKKSLAAEWGKQNKRPVCMLLRTPDPSTGTIKPNSLETYGHSKTDATGPGAWTGPFSERATPGNCYIKRDAATDRFQVLSDQFLVDAKSENSATVIRYYPKASAGQRDANTGFHPVAPNPQTLKTVRISQPTPNVVSVVQDENFSSLTAPKTRGFRWSIDGNTSVLTRHTGDPSICYPYERDRLTKTDLGNGTIQRVRTVDRAVTTNFPAGFHPTPPPPGYQPEQQDPPGGYSTVSRTMEQYRDLGNGNLRIFKKVEGYQTPKEVTTEYTYTSNDGKWSVSSGGQSGPRYAGAVAPPPGYTGPLPGTAQAASATNDYLGSRIATLRRSDGYWEDYAYDFNPGTGTMLTRIWCCRKNSAPGDHATAKETTITLEQNSRTVIEKTEGQVVSSLHEKLTVAADGTRTLREEKKSGANVTLVTETAYFPDSAAEPINGRIKYVRHPDGTLTRFSYSTVPDFTAPGQNALKTIKETGAADASQFAPAATGPVPALTMGTRIETTTNSFERVIDTKTYDIASGLLLEQAVTTTVDAVGRPTHIIHNGNPDDFETFTYACCGLKTHRARDGSVTDYSKDALGRPTTTVVTLGPKTTTTNYTYSTEDYGGQTLPKTTITQVITAGSNTTGLQLVSETIEDSEGRPLVSRGPDGNGDGQPDTTTYEYNPATRSTSKTGPDGVTEITTTYPDGQLHTSVRTFNGSPISVLTSYDYAPHNLNGGGIKTTVTESDTTGTTPVVLSSTTSFSDNEGRTFRTESPGHNGAVLITTVNFDERGRVIGQTRTGKPSTRNVLNLLGEITEVWTDSNGDGQFNNVALEGIKDGVTKHSRDHVTENQQTCARTRLWVRDDTDADILVATNYKSTDGLFEKSVPKSGAGPSKTLTSTKEINGNATRTETTYMPTGNLVTISGTSLLANGNTTTTVSRKDTAGTAVVTKSTTLGLDGRLLEHVGERGLVTTYQNHTDTGEPRKVIFSDGTYQVSILDIAGRTTSEETYDSQDVLIATVNTTYHPDGSEAAHWGTNTNPTYKLYDLRGRLKELRNYRSVNLTLAPTASTPDYDPTTWNYEPATGLLLSKRYADGKGPDYTYTPDGKRSVITMARNIHGSQNRLVKILGYTHQGQLKSIDYSDDTPDVSITYDRLNRKTIVSNGVATSGFDYSDSTLELEQETISYDLDGQPGAEFSRIIERPRDTVGRNSGLVLKNPAVPGQIENRATYLYSTTTGRLESVSGGDSQEAGAANTFSYTHVSNSSLIDAISGPVHTVDNVWEQSRNVLDAKVNKVGTMDVSLHDYTVNDLRQRVGISQTGSAFATNRTIGWGYDALGQVTSANSSENTHDRAFQYDAIGNRIEARHGTTSVTGTPNYTANALNQYSQVVAGADVLNPQFDDDGNMLSGPLPVNPQQLSHLQWDGANRLAQVENQAHEAIAAYHYDAFGRRIARKEMSGSTSVSTTLYVYNGWNCIAEYDGANQFALERTYLWGLDKSGSVQGAGGVGGMLLVREHGTQSGVYYPCYDGNGNISEYLDSTGQWVAHYEYDPYGNTVVSSGSDSGKFSYRHATKPVDSATGLIYYGYRWYDPGCGRWLSRDPITEGGGLNLYGMVGNDPLSLVDYLGLCPELLNAWDELAKGFFKQFALDYLKNKVGPMIAKRLATAGALSLADGPLPIGELISAGMGVWTAIDVAMDLWDLYNNWKDIEDKIKNGLSLPDIDCECLTPEQIDQLMYDLGQKIADALSKGKGGDTDGILSGIKDGKKTPWGSSDRRKAWKEKGQTDGKPPTREVITRDKKTGEISTKTESKELHHKDPRRNGGSNDSSNLEEHWPTDHAEVDPHRHVDYEVIEEIPDDAFYE